jgi:dienelactone hydrolase
MELTPRLLEVTVPDRPAGAVLVLHGGASRRANMMVSPAQLSVLRMIPIAGRIARAGQKRLAVFRLLNSRRGWDTHHTPVQDVRWGLDRVAERLGDRLPTCLVGHSLGGRAALLSAPRPEVRSVVALAPWVYPTDAPAGLSGEQILIVHGSRDRIASPERSEALARQLRRHAQVTYISVRGGKHAMLGHHSAFDGLAAQFAAATLLGEPGTGLIARALAGEEWLEA